MTYFNENIVQYNPNEKYNDEQHLQFNCTSCGQLTYREYRHIKKYHFQCMECLQNEMDISIFRKELIKEPLRITEYVEDNYKKYNTTQRIMFNCYKCGNYTETELRRLRNGKGLICLGCTMRGKKKTGRKLVTEEPYKITENFNKEEFEKVYGVSQKVEYNCVQCNKQVISSYFYVKEFLCGNCSRKKTNMERYGNTVCPAAYSKEAVEKRKVTYKERTGFDNPSQNPIIKQQKIETCKLHYGVESPLQNKDLLEKQKQTCLERYGFENPSQVETVKQKKIDTCMLHYGVEYSTQSEEVRQKVFATMYERYGVKCPFQSEEIKEKIVMTNLSRYGVEYPMQSEEIRQKALATVFEKYGVEYLFQSEEIKEKIVMTNLSRYGVKNPAQSEEIRQKMLATMFERYGVEYPSQSEEIKEKIVMTNLSRYGVEYPAQSEEIRQKTLATMFEKAEKSRGRLYKVDNIYFDSSWEVIFYLYHKSLGHNIKREPCSFSYTYNNKECRYFPDFEVDGVYYEVKGDYFFHMINGVEEMYNPYCPKEDKYKYKYLCMKEHNVIVIRGEEIENMRKELGISL